MAKVLLVGTGTALVEGLAQSLCAAGFTVATAHSLREAAELAGEELPVLTVVERSLAVEPGASRIIPMIQGGACVLYREGADQADPLPHELQRVVLAELTLPLERYRLLALAQRVRERLRDTGKASRPDHPRESSR